MDWSQLNDVSDWNDLSQMMEDGGSGSSSTENRSKKGGSKGDQSVGKLPEKGGPDHAGKPAQNPSSHLDDAPISGWSDMKQFDDDHDPDWFEEEEKRLASIYGGHFIKVKYTEQGRPGYFCELCLSEMNAKKSLESHCEGMKHLKKKALWEKNKAEEKDDFNNDIRKGGWSDGPTRDFSGRDRSPFSGSRDRSRSPGYNRRGRGFARPPKRNGPPRDQCVVSTGPTPRFENWREHDEYGWSQRSSPPRGFYEERENPYPKGRPLYGRHGSPPQGRNDYRDGRRSPLPYSDEHRRDRHEGPSDRSDHRPRSPVRSDSRARRDRKSSTEGAPITIKETPTEKLNGSITGLLLTKLTSCYIKDEEDADLAMNVISALASSLREYNTKIGEMKIAELLMETELKLNTLKALKVGLKLLNKNQTPGSAAAAAAAAAATAAVIPRPTYSASTSAATGPPNGGLSNMATYGMYDHSEARYGGAQPPNSFSQTPAYTDPGTPYPPNYRHHAHPY